MTDNSLLWALPGSQLHRWQVLGWCRSVCAPRFLPHMSQNRFYPPSCSNHHPLQWKDRLALSWPAESDRNPEWLLNTSLQLRCRLVKLEFVSRTMSCTSHALVLKGFIVWAEVLQSRDHDPSPPIYPSSFIGWQEEVIYNAQQHAGRTREQVLKLKTQLFIEIFWSLINIPNLRTYRRRCFGLEVFF